MICMSQQNEKLAAKRGKDQPQGTIPADIDEMLQLSNTYFAVDVTCVDVLQDQGTRRIGYRSIYVSNTE